MTNVLKPKRAAKILQGADPPHSEQAVAQLLHAAGLEAPMPLRAALRSMSRCDGFSSHGISVATVSVCCS